MPAFRPRLRALEVFPTALEGEQMICLRDPSGLTDRIAFLPPAAVPLVALCDGTRTVGELCDAFAARSGGARVPEAVVQGLIDQLDDGLFLDSDRFHRHRQAMIDEFRSTPLRPAVHAGASYPDDARELARMLDEMAAPGAAAVASPPPVAPEPPSLLIAPHIDFPRGGAVYASAFAALPVSSPPDLVVVFGTDHNGAEHPFTLTRKSYDTPFGAVATDCDLVDAIARAGLPGLDLFADEFHHKNEHSIEFQAVWLRRTWGSRTPPMLPVLCGSLHEYVGDGRTPAADPRVRAFLAELRRLTAGRRVLVIAGADLAHVGPRFGDDAQGAAERAAVEAADRASLAACVAGDAEAFFAGISADGDSRRVCGLSPIYASLALVAPAGRPGVLYDYAQCDADEDGESFVSIASLAI